MEAFTNMLAASDIIILLGPPGAGKGTHAVPLSKRLKLPHISTGDLFRSNLGNNTILGKKAKYYMDRGELVSDELVIEMLLERIAQNDCRDGYILDGFPRTLEQAKAFEKHLKKNDNLTAVYLQASDSILVERITGRLSCKNCGAVFHVKHFPPKDLNQCDHCDFELHHRKDDSKEIVSKRLMVYHVETKPLIQFYKDKGNLKTVDVNGSKNKDEVFHEIVRFFPVKQML